MATKKTSRGRQPRDNTADAPEEPKAPEGSLAYFLAQARIKAGFTKTQMAEKLRVRPPVITKTESGQHDVSEGTVRKYAVALGCRYELRFVKIKEQA